MNPHCNRFETRHGGRKRAEKYEDDLNKEQKTVSLGTDPSIHPFPGVANVVRNRTCFAPYGVELVRTNFTKWRSVERLQGVPR